MARPRPARPIREAYEAPYRRADRRAAIAHFVEDIPLSDDHPSRRRLDEVAAGLEELVDLPALLLWGPSDPIFSELYLRDLAGRLPAAEIHRFEGSGHLVPEDADVASVVYAWVDGLNNPAETPLPVSERAPMWDALDGQAESGEIAMVEMGPTGTQIAFAQLHAEVGTSGGRVGRAGRRPGRPGRLDGPAGDRSGGVRLRLLADRSGRRCCRRRAGRPRHEPGAGQCRSRLPDRRFPGHWPRLGPSLARNPHLDGAVCPGCSPPVRGTGHSR